MTFKILELEWRDTNRLISNQGPLNYFKLIIFCSYHFSVWLIIIILITNFLLFFTQSSMRKSLPQKLNINDIYIYLLHDFFIFILQH